MSLSRAAMGPPKAASFAATMRALMGVAACGDRGPLNDEERGRYCNSSLRLTKRLKEEAEVC